MYAWLWVFFLASSWMLLMNLVVAFALGEGVFQNDPEESVAPVRPHLYLCLLMRVKQKLMYRYTFISSVFSSFHYTELRILA